jgi:hypothetical protein
MEVKVESIKKVGTSPKIEHESAMIIFSIGELLLSSVIVVDTAKTAKLFNKAIRTNKMPEVINMMSSRNPAIIFRLKF